MKTIYQDYQVVLSAGEFRQFQCHGRYLTILDNSLSTDMMISFDGQAEQPVPKGISIELPEQENFVTLGLRNPAGSSATLRFAISNGKVDDNRNVISGTVTVEGVSNTITTPVKGTATTGVPGAPAVAAAGANRKVIIQNLGANDIWFGDSNVDGANSRGTKILPGDGYEIDTAAAIYIRSTVGNSDYSLNVFSKV